MRRRGEADQLTAVVGVVAESCTKDARELGNAAFFVEHERIACRAVVVSHVHGGVQRVDEHALHAADCAVALEAARQQEPAVHGEARHEVGVVGHDGAIVSGIGAVATHS